MADNSNITNPINETNNVTGVTESADDYSLDQLLRLIRFERTSSLRNEYKSTLNKVRMGELKTKTLSDLRRYINLSKEDNDGKFDASNQEFKDLVAKAQKKYENLSQELINAGETPDSIETFGDLLTEVGIVPDKNEYNASETKAIIDSIKMTLDQITPINEMHMQTVTRLEGEMNETYQMLMSAYKPLNNVITMMARGIKGQ